MLSALVMIGLPWLAVNCVSGDGMIPCLLLFYAVNPVFSVFLGRSAGKSIRKHWFLPVFPVLLFLAGAWFVLGANDAAFYLYAGVYLALGIIAMLISALRHRQKPKDHDAPCKTDKKHKSKRPADPETDRPA